MSDILFGQSYYLRFDAKLWEAMQPFPPLGTLYAASFMRNRGYQVALFDAMLAESEDEWKQALEQHRPRFAVIYEDNFNYLSKMCLLRMRQAAFTMINMARQRACTVIVCGADATDHAELYLEKGADYILLGEGELTLVELLDRLSGRTTIPLEQISGLTWRDPMAEPEKLATQGEDSAPASLTASDLQALPIRTTLRRPDIRDLDTLPFPAWDLVDVPRYRKIWIERHGYYAMNMVTTRGCPFHCNWCAKPIWGQRYNTRSPENVVAEMKWLKDTYQPDMIWFVDDILGLKPGWIPRFAELVEAEGARIPFKCLNRVDLLLREGEVEALQHAGASIIWVGAESGAQKILDAMDKGTRVDQIYQAVQRLHTASIKVGFFLQFGYPGETRQDIEKTLQMVRDCQPDDIGMSVSYPLPGTKFYSAVRQQLGSQQNWYDSEDLAMLYHGPFTTAFYRQLHTTLHSEFRAHKAWQNLHGNPEAWKQIKIDVRTPSRLRQLARFLYYRARLPLDRWRLERLARIPHEGITSLPPILTPEEAAKPSPQSE